MNKRIRFLLFSTPVIWLVIVAPLVILTSWWFSYSTLKVLAWSLLAAPLVTLWIFQSFQTANIALKWPATQLIGLCTILMNVVIFFSPLLFLLSTPDLAAATTIAWVLITYYAVWKALKVQNTKISVTSSKLNKTCRIMHLSDLHAGSRSSSFINSIVRQTIEQEPDIVLITGDLIDSSAVNSSYLKPLSRFDCPVYLCLGNHERYVNVQNAINAIESNNINILRSETAISNDLQITGIDDAEDPQQVAKELPGINRDNSKFQILMYHRPHGFEDAANAGIDLMLCGHTHAGQMWPFGILVKRMFPYIKGLYTYNNASLYVSQGTGTWGPTMRLGTSSEMTLIEADPA